MNGLLSAIYRQQAVSVVSCSFIEFYGVFYCFALQDTCALLRMIYENYPMAFLRANILCAVRDTGFTPQRLAKVMAS